MTEVSVYMVESQDWMPRHDGLGSTVALTNKEENVLNKYAYDDWGQVATNSQETALNPFKYIGRYGVMTEAADLVSMRARYYVPSLGRFTSKDPIGFLGGDLNLYAYVGNNSINLIDPWGLERESFANQGHGLDPRGEVALGILEILKGVQSIGVGTAAVGGTAAVTRSLLLTGVIGAEMIPVFYVGAREITAGVCSLREGFRRWREQ